MKSIQIEYTPRFLRCQSDALVTTALLKYGMYIEKLKLTAQAVHMQITMIYIVYMVNRTIVI